ncbi:sensor histidine kinase [Micromonospora craniellae]|uniref:histidine kinase n=1 Tax=Micromonospora craniellae TaxID=2294034 RepID=A0A372G0K6_9ACTN|nr:histidine kinase [Micromonospora craniellae]QOC91619.1 sensor histidine kinase [Micromonospora craniellae]RFS46601.1 sensor histidine kinase [Micromonospora craniellae]
MSGLLRSIWEEPAPSGAPRRVWRDWLLLAVLAPAALVESLVRPDLAWRPLSVAVAVALTATVLWRRTRPLSMVALAFGTCGLVPLLTDRDALRQVVLAFVLLLVYALFRWGSGRAAVVGGAIVLGKLGLWAGAGQAGLADTVAAFVVLFAVATLGTSVRYRARARQRELDQLALLERERLARDLHDTVAHHVSAIAIRAQAGLAVAATHPQTAIEALQLIEAEASRALAEMRGIVRVLRTDEPAALAPTPRIADLTRFVAGTPEGPAVEVQIVGDAGTLAPSVDRAVYRLVQESVTNARRHARHATRIRVRVEVDDALVRLRVSDDGESPAGPVLGSGYGLAGMAERAALLGGSCAAGPGPEQGWIVDAVLPRAGVAA